MNNTAAVVMVFIGGVLMYSGLKDWSMADTIQYFAGLKKAPSDSKAKEGIKSAQKPTGTTTPKTPSTTSPTTIPTTTTPQTTTPQTTTPNQNNTGTYTNNSGGTILT